MKATPAEVKSGDTFEILAQVEIAAAHHLYASNAVGKPFVPVTLKLTLPAGIEALGDWTATPPVRAKNGDFIYHDSIAFRRSLRIGSNVSAGRLSIGGELRYQACTDELCWPPRTIKLSAPVSVGSSKQ